jgi:hypothetical protein
MDSKDDQLIEKMAPRNGIAQSEQRTIKFPSL